METVETIRKHRHPAELVIAVVLNLFWTHHARDSTHLWRALAMLFALRLSNLRSSSLGSRASELELDVELLPWNAARFRLWDTEHKKLTNYSHCHLKLLTLLSLHSSPIYEK